MGVTAALNCEVSWWESDSCGTMGEKWVEMVVETSGGETDCHWVGGAPGGEPFECRSLVGSVTADELPIE